MIIELIELIKRVQKNKMRICEVGCWKGESTVNYAPVVKVNQGTIIVVDWFSGNVDAGEGPHSYVPHLSNKIYEDFMNNLINYHDIITVLRGDTGDMAKFIPDNSLDLCFIDVCHKYSKVKSDIDSYLPKVKIGGILCGHDFDGKQYINSFTLEELEMDWCEERRCHAGVTQAVYDRFGNDIEILNHSREKVWVKRV